MSISVIAHSAEESDRLVLERLQVAWEVRSQLHLVSTSTRALSVSGLVWSGLIIYKVERWMSFSLDDQGRNRRQMLLEHFGGLGERRG